MSNKKKTTKSADDNIEEVKTVSDTDNNSDSDADKIVSDNSGEKPEEKNELQKAEETIANLSDRLMRTAAEFDNYKKRSSKEKNEIYSNAVCDTVAKLLPILDNLERAVVSGEENTNTDAILEGLKMVKKQFEDSLSDMGVLPISSVGEQFDPEKHNAVMTEDSDESENTILDEFMKGYTYGDKIVRHSMVKVSK